MKLAYSNFFFILLLCGSILFPEPPDCQEHSGPPARTPPQCQDTGTQAGRGDAVRLPYPEAQPQAEEARLREAMQRAPDDPSYPARLGSLLAGQNKLAEAVPYFEKALKLNPGDLVTRRNLAASYWQIGKLPEARNNLETILAAKPDDAWSALLLGMVSEDLGDHQVAAKLLGGILPLVRQRPETITSLARAYYHLGETQKARDTLQMLVGHPAGPEATFQGGRAAAESGDYATAEKMFFSIRTAYPDPALLNYHLALAQYSARRYADCEKTLQDSIASGHATGDMYGLLGWTYQKLDRVPEMVKAFEKAINLESSNLTHYLDLGEALLEKKDNQTAMEVAKETVKRFPSSPRAFCLKGDVELRMYLQEEALKSYSKAIELDPNDPKAALGYAVTQWNANRHAEAAKSFEEGARRFPRDAFFLLKYALFLLNAPEEVDTAKTARIKALLKRSEELDDSIAETHFQLGNLATREDKYGEALKELEIAARQDPELPKVHYVLGRVYRKLGRQEDAERETEIYRKLKEKEKEDVAPNAAMGTRHP